MKGNFKVAFKRASYLFANGGCSLIPLIPCILPQDTANFWMLRRRSIFFSHRELDAICGLQEGSDWDGLAICQYIDPLINIVPQAIEESINRLLNKMNYPHARHFWRWFCSLFLHDIWQCIYKTYFFGIRNRRWRPQFPGSLRRRRRKGNLSIFTLDVVQALRSLVEYHAGVAEVL